MFFQHRQYIGYK